MTAEVYKTYTDKHNRTNVSVLAANFPVVSHIEKKIFPAAPSGYITANHDVIYMLNDVRVLINKCQFMLLPDKSSCSMMLTEHFFANSISPAETKFIDITKEQFEFLKELWEK